MNEVLSDKVHESSTQKDHYDVNTKMALGALHSGMGNTQVNKFFAAMDIPSVSSKVFKVHEREVGVAGEIVAKESCKKAALAERELTIQNENEIIKLLPDHLKSGFIVSDANNNTEESIVRCAGSWDLGWSTRGNGKNYDGLNGFGSLIGRETGKVLDFSTKQRKCRKCDLGHPREDHDCRLNFVGSAKAMEPAAAIDVTTNSLILKECKMDLGIFIGDDDCSTIAAVRYNSNHEVIKFSDKNHTSKGVTNELYKIKPRHKELTKDAIQYLHRCFTYSLAQNQGCVSEMASSICNIPEHCFNNHSNCGDWCQYRVDPDNYRHSIIGEGFQSESLLKDLRVLFKKFADNAHKFVAGASSQSNESLNATMASKAPKSRCYSTSESTSFRYAYSVCQKNIGEDYIGQIAKKLNMSPGKNTAKHIEKVTRTAQQRSLRIKKPEFKKRRLFLKARKTQLRYRKEKSEGVIYESDMVLINSENQINIANTASFENDSFVVVYFDLETSDFGKNGEILQIAAKCFDLPDSPSFSTYTNPLHRISESASIVNGLTVHNGCLLFNGTRVDSVTLQSGLINFYTFLITLKRKCVLTAHNSSFDERHLLKAIKQFNLKDHFESVIYGFVDSLSIIRKKTGKKGKGANSLSELAKDLDICKDGAHNAIYDVEILHEIIMKLKITENELIDKIKTWQTITEQEVKNLKIASNMINYVPLHDSVSNAMKKKMILADITYEMLVETYKQDKIVGLRTLLGKDNNGIVRVTNNKKVILQLANFLEKIN